MDWKNKKVLVTGSEGFIGSHLVEKLLELGANVKAFVMYNNQGKAGFLDSFSDEKKSKIKIIFGNILELGTLQRAFEDVEIVFHLAASISVPYSFENPEEVISTNAIGTLNVLTAARSRNIKKLIITSSSEVYGSALFTPITEEHPLQAQSPYAASKISGDKFAESFYKAFQMPVIIVRPFNTFGPRQSARAVIPTIIMQALKRDKIELGSLHPRRDFLFVKDTAAGFVKIAECGEEYHGRVFNLSTGQSQSIGETAEKILKIIGKNTPIVADDKRLRPEKAEVNELLGDSQKIRTLANWKPEYTFEEGLKETIKWIEQNIDLYEPERYYK
jgi:NAD dependent epimerase/dehydratase